MAASFEILAVKDRTTEYQGTIYQADGVTVYNLAASDKLRIKIGRQTGTPSLDMLSGTALSGGSLVTITDIGDANTPATYSLLLGQDDLGALNPGPYNIEVNVVDDSVADPADATKFVQFGVLNLLEGEGGNQGL